MSRNDWPRRMTLGVAMALGLVLAGCQAPVEIRGNLPEEERLAQIEPGVHTRSDVQAILGSPSAASAFEDNQWYYVGSKTRHIAFFDPEVLERTVVIVEFDDLDRVAEKRQLALEDGQSIAMVSRETPTEGSDMTVLQQLLGNLGRFDPADTFGGQQGPGSGRGQLPAP